MKQRNLWRLPALILACCLVSSAFAGVFLANVFGQNQYRAYQEMAQYLLAGNPGKELEVMEQLKEQIKGNDKIDKDYLAAYGYRPGDFAALYRPQAILAALVSTTLALFIFLLLFKTEKNRRKTRIQNLTSYLEKVNTGKPVSLLPEKEDEFTILQDEISKTVTELYRTKEEALNGQEQFAKHLANIAHQIKTPISSISIAAQLMEQENPVLSADPIKKQSRHLENLANILLTLSRLDAGVLKLEKKTVDVFTMLQLSIDNVDEILRKKQLQVSLPNHSSVHFQGDLDWSVEAFLNLLKNCGEHTPEQGSICLDYASNPLYTEITIQDSGKGFAKEELPKVFERFYQGEGARKTNTGIGLSLAKSIIEQQNGIITARNAPGGGALFTVRFYRH